MTDDTRTRAIDAVLPALSREYQTRIPWKPEKAAATIIDALIAAGLLGPSNLAGPETSGAAPEGAAPLPSNGRALAAIERAAAAIYERDVESEWDNASPESRRWYVDTARAALAAAEETPDA